jgi:prepilin-type N-terminal cleavage/methylation domain-containing protein
MKTRTFVQRSRRRGFTLLEALLALIIIGVGVLAFVDAQAAFTQSNNWSSRAATGVLLANEIREMSRRFTRHDPVTGLAITQTGGMTTLQGWGRENGEVAVDDLDDLDDLDGVVFGSGGTFAGPVDAFGAIVPQMDVDGNPVMNGDQVVPMAGWRQRVIVDKVDPWNYGLVRGDAYEQAAGSQFPAVRVDQFPLRVTVVVEYQAVGQTQAEEITRLTWVVPR